MIKGEYEQLVDMAANNICAADGGTLSVPWHQKEDCYYLRCGVCGETKAIKRVMSLTEEHKAGAALTPNVQDKVEKSISRRQEKQKALTGAVTMGGIPATDLGSGELLDLGVMKALVDYAHKYQLDPHRGHVCLMYGKPYVTIDGYLYHANSTNKIYSLDSRPLTKVEMEGYNVKEGAHAWISTVRLLLTGAFLSGIGIVTQEEMTEKSKRNPSQLAAPVVARHPWQLAQKRAEWQALRRAFPIGESPQGEEK